MTLRELLPEGQQNAIGFRADFRDKAHSSKTSRDVTDIFAILNSFNVRVIPSIPIIIHDSVESVCNGEHCAVSELTANRLLNELIRFQVHRGRGFIENQDLTFTEQRTG